MRGQVVLNLHVIMFLYMYSVCVRVLYVMEPKMGCIVTPPG